MDTKELRELAAGLREIKQDTAALMVEKSSFEIERLRAALKEIAQCDLGPKGTSLDQVESDLMRAVVKIARNAISNEQSTPQAKRTVWDDARVDPEDMRRPTTNFNLKR